MIIGFIGLGAMGQGIVPRLLAAGHEIEEVWIGENSSGVWRRRDRRLRWLAPTWSIAAAMRRWGVRVRRVGPLRRDPQLANDACRPHVDAVLASCFPFVVPERILAYYHGRICNLHPALLPRYRGPCPMPAILFDEALSSSGVWMPHWPSWIGGSTRPVTWPFISAGQATW